MIKVAVFEDNKARRNSLRELILSDNQLICIGTFENGIDAVSRLKENMPDVVLMDIGMPGLNGIETTKDLKKSFPKLIILIQTIHEDDENLFNSLKAGASGYILKRSPPEKIIEAIKDALAGGAPISPAMAFKVLQYFQSPKTALREYGISEREREILSLLVNGYSYKRISAQLFISYHTVNAHIRSIYEKLHVHSVSEAVGKTLKEDLLN